MKKTNKKNVIEVGESNDEKETMKIMSWRDF